MFRIRRGFDDVSPVNRQTFKQVGILLKQQFDALKPEKIDRIPHVLRHPVRLRPRRYGAGKKAPDAPAPVVAPSDGIALVVNDRLRIHHVTRETNVLFFTKTGVDSANDEE